MGKPGLRRQEKNHSSPLHLFTSNIVLILLRSLTILPQIPRTHSDSLHFFMLIAPHKGVYTPHVPKKIAGSWFTVCDSLDYYGDDQMYTEIRCRTHLIDCTHITSEKRSWIFHKKDDNTDTGRRRVDKPPLLPGGFVRLL